MKNYRSQKIWLPKILDPKKFQQYVNKVRLQVGPECGKPNLTQTKPNCHEHQGLSNYYEVKAVCKLLDSSHLPLS